MFRWLVLFILVAGWPGSAWAEAVTLTEAVRRAISQRPLVRVADARAEVSAASVGEALAGYLPQLKLYETYTRTNEPASSLFISLNQESLELSPVPDPYNFPPTRSNFETRLQFEQSILDIQTLHEIRRAREAAAAARYGAEWTREQAAYMAFKAYLGVQRARAVQDWSESARREAEELVRLAILRQENGTGLVADTLRAKVFRAEADTRRLRALNDLTLARRRLALATGDEVGEIGIAAPLPPDFFEGQGNAVVRRADLLALEMSSRAARQKLNRERSAWFPTVGLSASYTGNDPDRPGFESDSWMIVGRMQWSLFDGFRRERARQKAAAEYDIARLTLRDVYRETEIARHEALLRADEARLRYVTAKQAVAQAEESYALLRERYAAGLSDLSDLLGVQTALDRARAELVQAEVDLVQARGNIHFQQGGFMAAIFPGEVNK